MARLVVSCVLIAALGLVYPVSGQQPPSCEDQLAEVQATLSFVRASRHTTEENAGRVTAALQKRLNTSLKELDKLRHPEPAAQESPAPEVPQKDNAP